MADDSIYLVEHQYSWAQKATEEIAQIRPLLPATVLLQIEHVGSTSIPGIKAKPILDVNLLVSSIEAARPAIESIKRLGYQYWEENPDGSKMFFVKGMPPQGAGRTHHIWVYEDPVDFGNRVLFRDYLRAHPDSAKEYEKLKVSLASSLSHDREAYTEAKAEFVAEIIRRARS